MSQPPDQYDSPWKEALEIYLQSFLEFCFPAVAAAIDWSVPILFLDKELQEIVRDAAVGQQRVDKLVRVRLQDGSEEWILVHVEVQHQPDPELPRRIYRYHHRLWDRYDRRVVSLAILADASPTWEPGGYEESLLGCRLRFDFPARKLVDLLPAAQAALGRGNPSAVVIVANWFAQRTREDPAERAGAKWELTRRLYEAGLSRRDILELYRLIDWLLRLPENLELEFKRKVRAYEESKTMPYVTSIERMAREEGWAEGTEAGLTKGREQGRQQGREEGQREMLLRLLRRRWPALPPALERRVGELSLERQAALAEAIFDLRSLADLEERLTTP